MLSRIFSQIATPSRNLAANGLKFIASESQISGRRIVKPRIPITSNRQHMYKIGFTHPFNMYSTDTSSTASGNNANTNNTQNEEKETHEKTNQKEDREKDNEIIEEEDIEEAPLDEYLSKDYIPGLYPENESLDINNNNTENRDGVSSLDNEYKDHDYSEELSSSSSGDDSWFVDPDFENNHLQNTGNIDNQQPFVPLWKRLAQRNLQTNDHEQFQLDKNNQLEVKNLLDLCVEQLESDHAKDIKLLDVSELCEITDNMLIAESNSTRHMHALVDNLLKMIKSWMRMKNQDPSQFMFSVDGRDSQDWVVIDLGYAFIHVMTPEARQKYDLESLWTKKCIESLTSENTEATILSR
ncbi:hypothetical protein H4219_003089 [Mycoemilia scoparia]|uniref:Mitochondrial assembly of ribosomal large subunit protein 1 n=1 Tax=Mycoemilia scoparia TaxID=417184 RepID=A0A9W8DTV9_9FUNG|nr:hypothetical protein H4219_003089 [Mycoemilia scoparia]